MMRSALLLSLFLLTAGVIKAQVQSLGDLSFAVPDGWEYSAEPSGSRATLSFGKNGQLFAAVALFRPLRSTGNPDNDFRAAWSTDIRTMQPPDPIYEHKSLAGYQGRYGSTNFTDGHYVHFYSLEAGQTVIPIMVITPNRQTFDGLEPIIAVFVDGVRLQPQKAQPVKNSLEMSDLVGTWRSSGDSSVDYVNSSGSYAGSSTVAHGTTYTITSNGSYKSQFAGLANHQIVRGSGTGTVELGQGTIGFREGGKLSRYHFVSYQTALNGATVLTLLGDQYELSAANISFYAEKWVREPK